MHVTRCVCRLVFAILPLFASVPAVADSIVLKDGRKLEGEVVEETSAVVRFKMKGAVVTFKREEVVEVIRPNEKAPTDATSGSAGANTAARFREVLESFAPGDKSLDAVLLAACRSEWKGDDPRVVQALDANAEAIGRLIGLGDARACRFLEGVKVTPDTDLGHLASCRRVSRLVVLFGRREFAAGRLDAAGRAYVAALGLVEICDHDPTSVSRVVAAAVSDVVAPALRELVRSDRCEPGVLAALAAAIRNLRQVRRPWSTLPQDDETQGNESLRSLFESGQGVEWLEKTGVPDLAAWATEIRAMDAASRSRQCQEACSVLSRFGARYRAAAVPGRFADLRSLDAEVERARGTASDLAGRVFQAVPWANGALILRCVTADADLAACEIAIALLRYRKDKQQFPDNLGDLVPSCLSAVPQDPFDGRPMRYSKTGTRCLVWSIGPDLADDQGAAEHDPRSSEPHGDLVWALP